MYGGVEWAAGCVGWSMCLERAGSEVRWVCGVGVWRRVGVLGRAGCGWLGDGWAR
jgi:hypothetical protein